MYVIFLHYNHITSISVAHPASKPLSGQGFIPTNEGGQSKRLTTHLYLLLRLRLCQRLPPWQLHDTLVREKNECTYMAYICISLTFLEMYPYGKLVNQQFVNNDSINFICVLTEYAPLCKTFWLHFSSNWKWKYCNNRKWQISHFSQYFYIVGNIDF
jgi:hypothetical protein